MGKKKPQMDVVEYRMSIHFGICGGPVDYVTRIFIGEKEAWGGIADTLVAFDVNREDLFGGIKKEGGVQGKVTFLPGGPTQLFPAGLSAKFDLDPTEMPAYRGLATIFFSESDGAERSGFYWTANSPYLRGVWVTVARASVDLDNNIARIWRDTIGRRSIHFALDRSTSMAGSRLATMKSAMSTVLDILSDRITNAGLDVDIAISTFGPTEQLESFSHVTAANITTLKAFVNGLTAAAMNTDFRVAAERAVTWFGATVADTTITRRSFIFVTDGVPTQGPGGADLEVAEEAAATMADLLSSSGGAYNLTAGTAVNCYGINIDLLDTQYTAYLDNTPNDGVPVVSGSDPSGLVNAVLAAISSEFDSNPAHMIYECQSNRSWGAGIAPAGIDFDGYEAAAQTLYDESFGLSMLWSRQTTVEAFVTEIADHIEATVFLHPRTGLMTLKLIRDDYDIETLPVYTPDNSKILNFKRKLYGETINEIVLTWTNPENEQEETVTVQDDANIAIQGTIVSDGRNYYGIRTADLAARIAYRDLRAAATPLASCDIEMDRSAWDHVPGDVIKITSPEDGISQLVMRVGPIDYGKNGNSSIKAALAEDVFSLATAEYSTPPGTAWEDPSEEPSPADFTYIFTLPYFLVVNEVDPTVSTGADYPTVFAGVLAAEDGQDTAEFELWGELTDAGGGSYEASLGTKTIISHGLLAADLVEEATSVITGFDDRTQGTGPTVGGILIIGDGEEDEVEIAYVSAFDISGYTIKRGVLDTIPRAWTAGTPVWFLVENHVYADDEPRSEGELVEYQILTRTSLGTLLPASAPVISATLTARPHLPSRPANVKVNAIAFAIEVDCVGVDPIPVTWSERNRVTEDSVILAWDAATVTPEVGQTTRITISDLLGNELTVHDGLTGTSFDVPTASFLGQSFGYIMVESVRDGLVSLQGKRQRVKVSPITADSDLYTADTAEITADAG